MKSRLLTFYVGGVLSTALLTLLPAARCFAAGEPTYTSLYSSLSREQSPGRISFGFDSSATNGSRYGNTSWLGNFVGQVIRSWLSQDSDQQTTTDPETPWLVTRQTNAIRLGISYDLLQDRHADWATFAYLEDDDDFVGYFYVGGGIGMRYATGFSHGVSLYAGAGAGVYSVWLPGSNGVSGYKMFVGLQARQGRTGGWFVEGGYTHIASDGYTPRLSVVLGTLF